MLTLVGYFAKRCDVPPGLWTWLSSPHPGITELCSVSHCITGAPDGWVERWLHNDLAFFNTRADALSVIPADEAGYSLFAYRLLPERFVKGIVERFSIPELPVEPLSPSFRSLGFDVVNKVLPGTIPNFACSPLSCNGMAANLPVNTHCLIDTLDSAISVAAAFSEDPPEPGDYYVLEVLREPPNTAV